MNRPAPCLALVALSLLLAAAPAGATFIPYVGEIIFDAPDVASILMRPDGNGPPLTAARLEGGDPADATIHVRLVDHDYQPIAHYPDVDMWIQFDLDPGNADGCADYGPSFPGGVFIADHDTDADGWTEWTAPLAGGGWTEGPARVYVGGNVAMDPENVLQPPVPLRANSPDLDGDLEVDLTDIVLFSQGLGGGYHYANDFNWDGLLNLSDITVFTQAIGNVCE
jgi:hypothetical protein